MTETPLCHAKSAGNASLHINSSILMRLGSGRGGFPQFSRLEGGAYGQNGLVLYVTLSLLLFCNAAGVVTERREKNSQN